MENYSIQIRNLRKTYVNEGEKKEVLKGIDLDINPGEIIGYIGTNGAGKSTTVKILCGILNDYEGEVTIFGKSIKDNDYKHRIGYVPENGAMYDTLTAHEYLSFIAQLYQMDTTKADERITQLMTVFKMEDNLHKRIDSFSKGMKQKVLIISGLINNPDIIFLDEPLNGLDANAVIIFKEMLTQLAKQGKTIFYSSHLMDVVEKISDRIILLNDGVVVADGSYESLKGTGSDTLEELFSKLTNGSEDVEETKSAMETLMD